MQTLLANTHISPETAYVVADYPYGFKLRCQMRYWLEYQPKRGVRLVMQSSNPKRPGTWNKPKAGTYSEFGAALYLDDNGHVHCAGLSQYSNGKEAQAFADTYGAGVPEAARPKLAGWVAAKLAYDAARAEGKIVPEAVAISRMAFANTLREFTNDARRSTDSGEVR